jgi:hypothetical protein
MTAASSSKVQTFTDDQAYACAASSSSQRLEGTTHPGYVEWSREFEHKKILMRAAHTSTQLGTPLTTSHCTTQKIQDKQLKARM